MNQSWRMFQPYDRVTDRSDRPGTVLEQGTGSRVGFYRVCWDCGWGFSNRPRCTWMRFDRLTKIT